MNPDNLPPRQLRQVYLYGGLLLMLVNFAAPTSGLIDLPVSIYLEKRLHLGAHQLALFKLLTGLPLFASVLMGFWRDRVNPFGMGDRGHLLVAGGLAALVYALVALSPPHYRVFLAGLFAAAVLFQIVAAAGNGLLAAIGQRHAAAGRMSALTNIAYFIPLVASLLLGGWESNFLEGRSAGEAAQAIFLFAALLMAAAALFGVLGPNSLFGAAAHGDHQRSWWKDVAVLIRHRPLYPVLLLQLLWQFSPATGIALQYQYMNRLHGSDAQWGAWNALYLASFIPVNLVYGWLCRRFRLAGLLLSGLAIGVFQVAPLLFAHGVAAAWAAAVWLGISGGVASLAINDLLIRSAPPGFQGSAVMLFAAMMFFSVRGGDWAGTALYAAHGYGAVVLATMAVNALCLPTLLWVPRRLIITRDGEAARI